MDEADRKLPFWDAFAKHAVISLATISRQGRLEEVK